MRPTRPGSLTLLAILAFVFGGFSLLGALGGAMAMLFSHALAEAAAPRVPMWYLGTSAVWSLTAAALLVVGGIGLLKQSAALGRWPLTAWALGDIAMAAVGMAVLPGGRAEALGQVLGLVLPTLMLLWIHVICGEVWRPVRLPEAASDDAVALPPGPVHPVRLTLVQALRQTLRSAAGPGFLFAYLFLGLGLAHGITSAATHLGKAARETVGGEGQGAAVAAMQQNFTEGAVLWGVGKLTGEEVPMTQVMAGASSLDTPAARWARWLVRDHPPVLTSIFLLFSVLLPLVVPFAACGAIARDVGNRGFRFVLLRADRGSVFLGRLLAPVVLVSAATVALVLATGIGYGLADPAAGWGVVLRWSGWAAVALVLTGVPYVALGVLCSTAAGHPFAALAVANGVVVLVPALAIGLALAWQPMIHAIHLLPVAPQLYLFHPTWWVCALAGLACLVYAGAFLALGRAHFARRDL
jgi:hypothetical protein